MNPKCELLIMQYSLAKDITLQVIEKVPENEWFKQLAPGKAHPNWLLGHLTFAINYPVLQFCFKCDSLISDEWVKIYGPPFVGGDGPLPGPGRYKPHDELIEKYTKSMEAVSGRLKDFSDADLPGAPPGLPKEMQRPPFDSVGGLLSYMYQHDAHHRGQITAILAIQ